MPWICAVGRRATVLSVLWLSDMPDVAAMGAHPWQGGRIDASYCVAGSRRSANAWSGWPRDIGFIRRRSAVDHDRRIDFHSPEIDYLVDGQNGIRIAQSQDPGRYASVVSELLQDQDRLNLLRQGCRAAAKLYTNEEMVIRFADGIPARRHWATAQSEALQEESG